MEEVNNTFYIRCVEDDFDFDFTYTVKYQMEDLTCFDLYAEEVGEYYYNECNGLESSWPLNFEIYKDEEMEEFICEITVGMEMRPSFSGGIA